MVWEEAVAGLADLQARGDLLWGNGWIPASNGPGLGQAGVQRIAGQGQDAGQATAVNVPLALATGRTWVTVDDHSGRNVAGTFVSAETTWNHFQHFRRAF